MGRTFLFGISLVWYFLDCLVFLLSISLPLNIRPVNGRQSIEVIAATQRLHASLRSGETSRQNRICLVNSTTRRLGDARFGAHCSERNVSGVDRLQRRGAVRSRADGGFKCRALCGRQAQTVFRSPIEDVSSSARPFRVAKIAGLVFHAFSTPRFRRIPAWSPERTAHSMDE